MAFAVGPDQSYRLRDLRNDAVGQRRAELRVPTRRTRDFGEVLQNPKAGEVVGRFPATFDRGSLRTKPTRDPLVVARSRQHPRSQVAALMSREGVSTATKFTRRFVASFGARPGEAEPDDVRTETLEARNQTVPKPWMSLLNDAPTAAVEAKADRALEAARIAALAGKRDELKAADHFLEGLHGYSELEASMRKNDARILKEAGKMENALQVSGAAMTKQGQMMQVMHDNLALDQQLNMRYLAMQQKLDSQQDELLSNMLTVRSDAIKTAIDGEQ